LAAVALVMGMSPAVTSVSASAATFGGPRLNCPAETYPPAGTPRNSPGAPYQAPFDATLSGGNVRIEVPGALAGVTLGPPTPQYPTGTLFGEACGLLTLPSLTGPIPGKPYGANGAAATGNPNYNNNFILHGPPACHARSTPTDPKCDDTIPIPVELTLQGTGVPLLDGHGSADGVIPTRILPAPAANGGFNVAFSTSAKSTATLDPAQILSLLPGVATLPLGPLRSAIQAVLDQVAPHTGGECTVSIGDQRLTGMPADHIGSFTSPFGLSTQLLPTPYTLTNGTKITIGQPVTGPVTNGQAVAYGAGPQPPISPYMAPDPEAPGAAPQPPTLPPTSLLCSPAVAQLLNTLFGLDPQSGGPPGSTTFLAPVTFSAHVTR
jgi:hypothetical protein